MPTPNTNTTDKPACPKCGEPPRIVIVEKARVRCAVNADGTPGTVLSMDRKAGAIAGYECGGGHEWSPTL